MIEFGSDFHLCDTFGSQKGGALSAYKEIRYYACGRHAIEALICQERWIRLWVPVYFCYEVISHIRSTGIHVEFYDDNPLADDDSILKTLSFRSGDALLRVNYFGLRTRRSNKDIPVPVVEDHTHALISDWAQNSDADWCIASVRKTVPLAAGGILWSPSGRRLPDQLSTSSECEEMASIRYDAMSMKRDYLASGGDKDILRAKYIQSEEMIERLKITGMDSRSKEILCSFDLAEWNSRRKENWRVACGALRTRFNIIHPISDEKCVPFSLIIVCKTPEERVSLRQYLIEHNVYPAILWKIPSNEIYHDAYMFSELMLSVHCDGRYTTTDMEDLCHIINSYYD